MNLASVSPLLVTFFFFFTLSGAWAQKRYFIDASAAFAPVAAPFTFGNPGPPGKQILVNDRYLTLGGKTVLPVMGEMHFARVPRAKWEEVILQMKANGISIIASYIFWIHHKEQEGTFDWEGNKDLRAFVRLCHQHGLYVYPRLGPWSHGEARNGGTPDWLLLKKNVRVRSNDASYQHYADRWFEQIGKQLEGLTYKDGGPIIGVQLENEFVEGKPGEEHILWLKKTAIRYGLDVPLYTVTGWGNASIPPREVIPLFGAYPDEPWMDDLQPTTKCTNFAFSPLRNDAAIGNLLQQRENEKELAAYPYFTCEMGVGVDNTAHRRLVIDGLDGHALMTAKLGSGSNLIGYYMFAGGLNPTGRLTSMEENGLESGGYNTNPAVAYDFQAAIRKSGELSPSYHQIKKTHYFLQEFGSLLAPMQPIFASTDDELQLSVRAKDNQAFLFGIHYCRHTTRKAIKDAQFTVKLKSETITFPSQPVTIPDSSLLLWPINFQLGKTLLKYATAQPLCELNNQWVFIQSFNNAPEFCFEAAGIETLTSNTGNVTKKDGNYLVTNLQPGYKAVISITPVSGPVQKVIVLSQVEALQAWLLRETNQKHFFLSNANLYLNGEKLHVYGTPHQVVLRSLGSEKLVPDGKLKVRTTKQGLFDTYTYQLAPQTLAIPYTQQSVLEKAQWIVVNTVEKLNKKQVLHNHLSMKSFDLKGGARIKSAKLMLVSQSECRIQVNTVWVNQLVEPTHLNEIDLTGYLQQGPNKLLLAFPFSEGTKGFAAKLVIELFNNDRIEIPTDSTWRSGDSYTLPSALTGGYPTGKSELGVAPATVASTLADYRQYALHLPAAYPKGLNNVYVHLFYQGDRGRLYADNRLIDDNFNNHTYWPIGLNRYDQQLAGQTLQVLVYPLRKDARVYFDVASPEGQDQQPAIQSVRVLPEYQAEFRFR